MTDEVYAKVNKFEAMRQPDAPAGLAAASGSADRPHCGKCGKTMTPENSTAAPEYFLCDGCAVEVGLKPRRRIDPQARIKELLEAIEEIRQVATGERQVGNDDTDGLDWIARRIAALKPPNSISNLQK